MAWASASSPPTARPASCCRFSASGPRSPRCHRSSSRCASARRGWRTSATPTTPACGASIACRCPGPGSSIVSDHVEGTRLSDILRVAHERNLQLDINAALCLIRQLVPAVALLHENAREVAHGLIAPERLVVTPHARLVIVEHVLAAAVEQLQFSRDRLWQEFRISMPPSAGMPRFDHRADVTGIGLVALALVLGRPLHPAEFPNHLPALLNEARERTALGEEQPLSQPLRDWLARALQLDTRRAFASAPEALTGARGDRRRRFDVRRGAGGARDVPVALHRRAARTAGRADARAAATTAYVPAPPASLATSVHAARCFQPAAAPAASTTAAFEALPPLPGAPAAAPRRRRLYYLLLPRTRRHRRLRPSVTTHGPTPLHRRALGPRRATSPSSSPPPI